MGERQDSEDHLFANTLALPRFQQRGQSCSTDHPVGVAYEIALKKRLFFLLIPHHLLLSGLRSGMLKTLLHKGKAVGTPSRIWLPMENPRSKEATLLGFVARALLVRHSLPPGSRSCSDLQQKHCSELGPVHGEKF